MGGRLGREMQPAVDQEEVSEEWGCCAFSALRYGFIPLACMLFGYIWMGTTDRSTRRPDNFEGFFFFFS